MQEQTTVQPEQNSALHALPTWAQIVLLSAVTALGARFSALLPFTPVPISFQVFGVLLSGLLLGSRRGMLAQANYLMLGFLGLPIFALGKSGLGVLFWPNVSGGYLLAFPLAAFAVGWFAERPGGISNGRNAVLACASGLGIIYSMGCLWLALASRPMLSPVVAIVAGTGWFFAWDAVKALGAVLLARQLTRRP